MGKGDRLRKWRWQKGGGSPNPGGVSKRPTTKRADIALLTREIFAEEDPRSGRTELERLIRQMLRRAHQGSFKHAEVLLNYGFGKPLAVQQNLNVNQNLDGAEMSLEQVDAKLTEHFDKLGIPKPIWSVQGPVLDIEAIDARIEVLVKKREENKKPKPAPQLTEGPDSIQ